MSSDPDFDLADLTSAVENTSSVGIGDYSGTIVACGIGLCYVGWA